MKGMQALDQTAFDWFSDKPAKEWIVLHSEADVKCDMLLKDYCETFNSGILDAREKPILTMLECIREYLMSILQENGDMA